MAVDTREKRNSALSLLLPFFAPGVDPNDSGIQQPERQAAAWVYSGISAVSVNVVKLVLSYRRRRTAEYSFI